jgi:hypothetical protein
LISSWSGLSGLTLQRLSAEARYHAARTRAIDVWGGVEAGVAWWTFQESCGDCNASPAGSAIRYFGAYHGDSHIPSGLSPMMYIGLTLGVHIPR